MSKVGNVVHVAVVGHTNTGKTSLLRALVRDASFGEVSPRPSTTRHVELARLDVDGEALIEFYDTPGMEDSISLLMLLDDAAKSAKHKDSIAVIEEFLESEMAQGLFEQEAKVLRQLLESDVALYVIDARDPVLDKYKDELAILSRCAIPILPLLNFVADSTANESQWRDALARLGLHVSISFDTVTPEKDGEKILYTKLAALLEQHADVFKRLMDNRHTQAKERRHAALALLAELLMDVAAHPLRVRSHENVALAAAKLHDKVRAREQKCVNTLLNLYGFNQGDVLSEQLQFSEGRWEGDLFDPATLSAMGIKIGGGAAAGAATGLVIDLALGGATLGAAAGIGAIVGGGAQTLRHYGRRLGEKLTSTVTGTKQLRVGDDVLQLLFTRQIILIKAFEIRSHAAQEKVALLPSDVPEVWRGELRKILDDVRLNSSWSGMDVAPGWSEERQRALDAIANVAMRAFDVSGKNH